MYYANSQIDFPAYAATVFGSPPPMHHTHTHTINTDFQFFPSVCNELISRCIYCQIKVIGLRRMRSSCSPPHSHCCLHSRARAQRICRSIVHARARTIDKQLRMHCEHELIQSGINLSFCCLTIERSVFGLPPVLCAQHTLPIESFKLRVTCACML